MRRRLAAAAAVVVLLTAPTITAHALTPQQQCGQDNASHILGIAAPWDGACWAGLWDDIVHFASDSVATAVTRWVLSGAVETTALLLNEFATGAGTTPSLSAPWFQHVYYGSGPTPNAPSGQPGALVIAELLAVPLLVLTVIAGIVRGDIGGALKTVLIRLPLIVVLCFGFIVVLQRVFVVVDALSGWVVGGTITDFQNWSNKYDPSNAEADFAVVIVAIVIIISTIIAYIELFVRTAMLYLVIAFVPLIAVATLWQGSRTALRKTVEFLVVMTCSKLVMAFAFMVGAGAITSGQQSFAALLVGAVIFAVIAFAPFSLFALIPMVEVAAVGAVAGMGARFGGSAMSTGLTRGRRLLGGAAEVGSTTVRRGPGHARSAFGAGARRMQPLGNGLRAAGGGMLTVAGQHSDAENASNGTAPTQGEAVLHKPSEADGNGDGPPPR